MASNPALGKDGKQAKAKPMTQGNDHKPAKHIEATARLASSVEPNKNPERVRVAGERSGQP